MGHQASPRPLPDIRNAGRRYWLAAAEGVLVLPKCNRCQHIFWYPRAHCPSCGSDALEWVRSSGRGTVYTFTVVRLSNDPFFKTRVPYVVGMVELQEGPKLMSNIVECAIEDVHIGMPVSVLFEGVGEGIAIPLFRPAAGGTP